MHCVSRYCAIKGGLCEKELAAAGQQSCFVAYPFQYPFIDIVAQLDRQLTADGFRVEVPKQSHSGAGLLFCDLVCPMIMQSQVVVGDVTILNHNVFFELGYAYGLGKEVCLIRNTGQLFQENSILRSGLYVNEYEVPQDVIRHVRSRGASVGQASALFNGDDIPEHKQTVAVLTSNQKYQRTVVGDAIRECVARHGLQLAGEVGGGIELLRRYRMIKSAEWVVGALVADDVASSHEMNSETAFLLGIGVALGKKVLVLQQQPVGRPMIDLAGLLEGYDGLEDLRRIMHRRLDVSATRSLPRRDGALLQDPADQRELFRSQSQADDADIFAQMGASGLDFQAPPMPPPTEPPPTDVRDDANPRQTRRREAESPRTVDETQNNDEFELTPSNADEHSRLDFDAEDDGSAVISLEDSGIDLGAEGSDITLSGAGDSGISLESAGDSGLSLEAEPLGDDDDFLLTPMDDALTDDDGEQVIALDVDDFEGGSGIELA